MVIREVMMRYFLSLFFCLLFYLFWGLPSAFAQENTPTFPDLTGHVVDSANALNKAISKGIAAELAEHEQQTGNQVIVATIESLNGQNIEDYATALFNDWQLGQKDKNNGLLLLIAFNDAQLRIEVGDGLSDRMTNAVAQSIVDKQLIPEFKKGRYDQGIIVAVREILTILRDN